MLSGRAPSRWPSRIRGRLPLLACLGIALAPTLARASEAEDAAKFGEGPKLDPASTLAADSGKEPAEAPPPLPRAHGVVVESSVGALGSFGKWKDVAPASLLLRINAGYEITHWLYVFGTGELTVTSTSEAQSENVARSFPIYGFGGGARLALPVSDRVSIYAQGDVGLMRADVPHNTLAALGFNNAESFGLALGAHIGVTWFQIDRHMALGIAVGARDATGFKKRIGSDLPLFWDSTASLRYAF